MDPLGSWANMLQPTRAHEDEQGHAEWGATADILDPTLLSDPSTSNWTLDFQALPGSYLDSNLCSIGSLSSTCVFDQDIACNNAVAPSQPRPYEFPDACFLPFGARSSVAPPVSSTAHSDESMPIVQYQGPRSRIRPGATRRPERHLDALVKDTVRIIPSQVKPS